MASAIDFYFDFSSPYGYVASELVDALSQRTGRAITWRPMFIGAVNKVTGQPVLVDIPMKGPYAKRDFERSARFHRVPYNAPNPFPTGSVGAARAFYWMDERDPGQAREFARGVFRAYFVHNRAIGTNEVVLDIAKGVGVDTTALSAALADPALKERTRQAIDGSIALGVFGSPYFIVDGEPFWGVDRMPMVEEWVKRGGW